MPLIQVAGTAARLAAPLVCGRGSARRLVILIYHRVLPVADPLVGDTTAAEFDRQMAVLAAGFNVLRLREAVEMLAVGRLPPRAVCVTFDDGYVDNLEVALPILRRHRLHATFFIASGFADGSVMWNDVIIETVRSAANSVLQLPGVLEAPLRLGDIVSRQAAVQTLIRCIKPRPPAERADLLQRMLDELGMPRPTGLMMRPEQLVAMRRAGMDLGAHTRHHPILASLGRGAAAAEIVDGKRELEAMVGEKIDLFAYPNGVPRRDYLREHVEIVRQAGFGAAVSTARGAVDGSADRFQLPRYPLWGTSATRLVARLMSQFATPAGDVFA